MGRTPDRFPGAREDEALVLDDTGVDPSALGEIRRNGSDIKAFDGTGVFNLRQTGTVPSPGGIGHVLLSLDGVNFTSECPLIGDGWLVNENGFLLVVG